MRKLFLGVLAVAAAALGASAQTTLYYEDFDSPPHSVVNYHTLTGPVPYWNDTAALSVSAPKSYHAKVVPGDTVSFKTIAFSTVGMPFVWLSFDHIAKVHFGQRGYISVSRDSGQTWYNLGGAQYQGASTMFGQMGYVNEVTYNAQNKTPYWGGPTLGGAGVAPNSSWWAHETFDISSLVGYGPSGNGNGYSHVLVRFALQYRTYTLAYPAGWWVDNLTVTGSSVELMPPTIRWTHAAGKKPEGTRYTPTSTVQFRGIDPVPATNSGVDTSYVHYRLNGGAWTTLAVPPTGSCPDSSEFTAILATPNVGDSVDYWVEVKDCASNTLRDPAAPGTYYSFTRAWAPPAMCGSTDPLSQPFTVMTLPYTENFDGPLWTPGSGPGLSGVAHRGQFPLGNPPAGRNYEVTPNPSTPGFAWSVRQGPAPTIGSGPLADHTTGTGNYLYSEASQGILNDLSTFTTPCIKLDNLNHAALEFYYHKFGAHMGYLRVDIDTGTGFGPSSGVFGAALLPGATHATATEVWNSAILNLQPYLNKYIRVRFVAQKANSTSFPHGDMAIDDLNFFDQPAHDVNVLAVLEPKSIQCSSSGFETVSVRVANRGWQVPSSLPMAFSVTNVATGLTTVQRDTLPVTWLNGGIANLNFNDLANVSVVGTYELRAWAELPGDLAAANDTSEAVTLEHLPALTLPFYENFDGPSWVAGQGTAQNPGTMGSSMWVPNPPALLPNGSIAASFYVGKDLTPKQGTGPRWSRRGRGNYLYVERSMSSITDAATAYWESTQCIDLSTAVTPMLSFNFHMFGAGCGSLSVEFFSETTNQWTLITNSVRTGPVQISETDDWQLHQVSLNSFAGQRVRLRIKASTSGTSDQINMAIDDVLIYDRPVADVGAVAITAPGVAVQSSAPAPISVLVRNFGKVAQPNVPVTVILRDRCTPTQTAFYTGTAINVPAGGQATVVIPSTNLIYTPGDMEILAFTTLAADAFAPNDTVSKGVNVQISRRVPFGPLSLDGCDFDQFGFFVPPTGLQMWEFGQSQRGISAASGQNAWHLGRSQDGYGPSTEVLRFPALVGLDTTYGTMLRFKHRFDFASGNGGRIEYLEGTTWLPLYDFMPLGSNWYPYNYGSSSVTTLSGPGWSGSTGGSYIISSFPLTFWEGRSQPLYLRVRFSESGVFGTNIWAIDDIEVSAPPQNSVALLGARPETALLEPGDSTRVQVLVQNDAERPVLSLALVVHGFGGTALPQTVTLPAGGITKGQSMWVTLPDYRTVTAAGTLNPCVSVYRVNGQLDQVLNSDSLCFKVVCVAPEPVNASTPFCADFESSDWPTESFSTPSDLWTRTTPNHGALQNAYNGTKAYVTGPAQYPNGARDALYSPAFVVDTSLNYVLSFYHNMQAEQGLDGGMLQYSYDDQNWHQLGNIQSPGAQDWCTTPVVLALDGRSGWSGTWTGYSQSTLRFAPTQSKLRFRLLFASTAFIPDFGWAVDQLCISVDPSPTPALTLDGGPDQVDTGCF